MLEDANEDFESLSPLEIKKLVDETRVILQLATNSFNSKATEVIKVQEELAPIVEKYQKLAKQKKDLETAMSKIKPEIDNSKRRLERLDHWLRRARLRELEQKEFERLSRELDELTAGAKWREWAFQHQIEGAKKIALVGGRAVLGDKRGLGKSLTSLIVCDMVKSKKIIIFAPKETIKNFEDEIKRWAGHRTLISLIGQNKTRRDFVMGTLPYSDEWILTVNLEAWRRDKSFVQQLAALEADTVIVDEAHFIKDPESVACKGIMDIVHAENSSVKHVLPMTGTPILNNPGEMWPLLNLVDKESFPNENLFLHEYCMPNGAGRWRFRSGGEKKLLQRIGGQFIQRDRKSAGVIIPPQTIQYHDIEFDKDKYPKQYRAYKELKEQWVIFSNEIPEAQMAMPNTITAITRMRQMMVWPAGIIWRHPMTKQIIFQCDVEQSIKVDYAVNLIQELVEEGERVVLFSQFKPPMEELAKRLRKISVSSQYGDRYINPVILNGDTPEHMRDKIRYDFDARNNSNQWDVVLAHYRVGGQSLNFTAATQMIILDREWNDGREDQARGRIDRLGQTRETTVHVLRVADTIDTWMDALIQMKKRIVDGFENTHIDLAADLRKAIQDGEV